MINDAGNKTPNIVEPTLYILYYGYLSHKNPYHDPLILDIDENNVLHCFYIKLTHFAAKKWIEGNEWNSRNQTGKAEEKTTANFKA